MLYDHTRLKQNAKAAMAHANPKTWVVTLLFLIILGTVGGTVKVMVPTPFGEFFGQLAEAVTANRSLDTLLPSDYEEMFLGAMGIAGVTAVLSTGASVILVILRSLMNYGFYGYGLVVSRRETRAGVGSLFRGFPKFRAVIGSAVLVGVFSLMWGLLIYGIDASITVLLLVLSDGTRWLTWLGVAILFLAAVLVHALVTYRYCLVPYLVLDDRQKTPVTQLITVGVQTMKGNIFKRFVLDLSFLGWELLRGLIAVLVAVLSSAVALLVTGSSIITLIDLNERASQIPYETVMAQAVAAFLALAVAFLVVFGLTALAQLPLKLWLMSYKNVARAGFYQELMGEKTERVPVAAAAPISASAHFVNTQPAAPVTLPPVVPVTAPEPTASPVDAPYTPFSGHGEEPVHVPFEAPAEPETSGADVSSAPETVVPTAPETADQASPALAEEEPTASGPFLPTEEGEGPGKTDE